MPSQESDKESKKDEEKQPQVILIAHLEANLLTGETIDLLPIRHENDVKSDVIKLLEDWAESGFLLRGNVAYPWHQVKTVVVTKIDELSPQEAHQRMLELEGASRAQIAKGFWKTREDAKEKDGKKEDDKDDQKDDKKS